MNILDVVILKRLLAVCAVLVAAVASLPSQTLQQPANRITENLAFGPLTTIAGTVHPLTQRATDLGPVDAKMRMDSMTMNVSLSPAQQKELNELLEAQQDPNSPQYHQWLTQKQFGARFGLSDADLGSIKSWLAAQGFKVKSVSSSRNAITFSGTPSQVVSAFHTQLRQYGLNGEVHFANATALRIPLALAAVMVNVRGLNNFRPKANINRVSKPQFTTYSGDHFLAPGDWATIYDVTPIYTAGFTGLGAHVGVVGQTYVPQADIDHFRTAAGLTSTKLNYQCISSADCTDVAGTSTDGDLSESDLDIEWAGGIAKNATVDFIYASHSDTTQDVFDALQYAVQQYNVGGAVVPVLSMSYESCEQEISPSDASYFLNLAQQANAQGQTIVVSAGDSGAAGCDPHGDPSTLDSTWGLSVGVPADIPNVTGVGGTIFSDPNPAPYWSTSTTVVNTALQYIPEVAWNETGSGGLIAGGGGVSTFFPTPSWQWAPGNFTGTAGRFVPDVSFTASWDHDAYLVCSQVDNSTTYGTTCTNGFLSSLDYFWFNGGTSASAPSFAGMLTLLSQKYGPLGNVNQTLYSLASNPTTYASVFHDVTSGNNIVPCVAGVIGCVGGELGYQATAGYDLATGLGSINGGALYSAMATVSKLSESSVVLTSTSGSLAMGETTTLTATVSSTLSGTITGTVTFASGNVILGSATIANGAATLSGVQIIPANGFVAGTTDFLTANYSGDATLAASIGSMTLAVAPLPTTTTTVTVFPTSVTLGSPVTLSASVSAAASGPINGTVTFNSQRGTVGTVTLANNTATLSNITTSIANGFIVGSDTMTASYNGDPMNFASSSGTTTLAVAGTPTTTSIVTVFPPTLALNGTITLTAQVASPALTGMTGTVTFKVGSATLGTAPVISGAATLSNVYLSISNGFLAGPNAIIANYSGDSTFASSSCTTNVTLLQQGTMPIVSVSATSVTWGATVSVNAYISPGGATGTVTFAVGSTALGTATIINNNATLNNVVVSQGTFGLGENLITANYSGDSNSLPSNSFGGLDVYMPTTTTINAAPSSALAGSTITLTATVNPIAATGAVYFSWGNQQVTATLAGGVAQATVVASQANGFAAGLNTITANYPGLTANGAAPTYWSSSATTTFTFIVPTYTLTASPTAVSLSDGTSATIALALNSSNYAGAVSFATSVSSSSISASAPAVTLTSGGSGSSTLTIAASSSAANRKPKIPGKGGGAILFCAVLLGAPLATKRKRTGAMLLTTLAILMAASFMACGGSGSGGTTVKPARTYTVTVTPTGTGSVTNPSPMTVTVTVQ